MTNTHELILKLKAIREEKGLSYTDILHLMEENGDYVSKSTLSRIFSEGSENLNFMYEDTLKPIATALLDIDNIEDTDNMDVQAMKLLLKYKMERITELESQIEKLEAALDHEKLKSLERLEDERAQFDRKIDFLKRQIELKDDRMDKLLEAVFKKDSLYNDLLEKTLNCGCCTKGETV